MKKNYFKLLLFFLAIFTIIYSCNYEEKTESNFSKKNNIFSRSAKYNNINFNPSFTNGGEISLTDNQIKEIYYTVSGSYDYQNISQIFIYTTGNQYIDITKVVGVSFFKKENGSLKNYFYKRENNKFIIINELSLKLKNLSLQDLEFMIYFSKLPKNQLSLFYTKNPTGENYKSSDETNPSDEFDNFKAYYFGSQIHLDESLSSSEIENLLRLAPIANGNCRSAAEGCGYDVPGECIPGMGCDDSGGMDDGGSCRFSNAQHLLEVNSSELTNNFDDVKTYSIRDNIMENSLFGLKYETYYYHTDFSRFAFSLEDAIEAAKILPDVHVIYNDILSNNSNNVLVTEELSVKINSFIDNLINKNAENDTYLNILNDVKRDVNYLKNKTVGEINNVIY